MVGHINFVVVGFGNLRLKIYSHLQALRRTRDMDILVVETEDRARQYRNWTEEDFRREVNLGSLSKADLSEAHHHFLKNLHSTDEPKDLLARELEIGRNIFYLAVGREDLYPNLINQYAKWAHLIALEKPV